MQRPRILTVALLLILMSVGIGWRLVQLQGVEWRDHALRASSIHRSIRYSAAPRGQIVDAFGVSLARDTPVIRATFLLSELEPVRWVARRLAPILRGSDQAFPWDEMQLWTSLQMARARLRPQFGAGSDLPRHPWLSRLDLVSGSKVARAVDSRPEDFPGISAVRSGDEFTVYFDPDVLFAGEIAIRRMEQELALEPGHLWARVEEAYQRVQDSSIDIQEREWIFRRQLHPLHEKIPSQLVVEISTDPQRWPGIHLEEAHDREHPQDPFLGQLLGHTGLPTADIVKGWKSRHEPVIDRLALRDLRVFEALRPFAHHSADRVGRSGLESVLEQRLSGIPGAEVRILDHLRRKVGAPLDVAQPIAGKDVVLALDVELSRWCAQTLMSRQVELGAVVVLDVSDGSAIGWASLPQQGMEVYRDRDLYRSRSESPDGWFHDRVSGWAIDPGSTFKTVVALTALQAGVVDPEEIIVCEGLLDPRRPGRNRCGNHPYGLELNMTSALSRSCNVYFYTMGQRLGLEALVDGAVQLGLWSGSGCSIPSESVGIRPTTNPVGTAIGRGFTTTPLQMARVALSIASRGETPGIQLIAGESGTALHPSFDRRHYETVIDGMVSAVRDRGGTASRSSYRLSEFDLAVKTGTAQIPGTQSYNAWLIGFSPVVDPQIAFAISAQGVPLHGGEACAPMLADILQWLEQHRGLELRR